MLGLLLLPFVVQGKSNLESVLDRYIVTPFGYWDSGCVHSVDAGSTIVNYDDHFIVKDVEGKFVRKVDRCKDRHNSTKIRGYINEAKKLDGISAPEVDGDGWQEYTKMDSGDSTDAFLGNWVTPALPQAKENQILYMFTGLQNIDWVPPEREPNEPFDIIQPVMTFGHSPPSTGAGEYWSCASWYVTLGRDVVYSKPFGEMSVGSKIFGNMTKTGPESWYINCVNLETGKDTPLNIERSILKTQPWIYVTLEVYFQGTCSEYPPPGSPVPFTDLTLFENGVKKTIDWEVGKNGQNPPICGSSVEVNDPTSVTIKF